MTIKEMRDELWVLDDSFCSPLEYLEASIRMSLEIWGHASASHSEFDPGKRFHGIDAEAVAQRNGWKVHVGRMGFGFFPGSTPAHVMNSMKGPIPKKKKDTAE